MKSTPFFKLGSCLLLCLMGFSFPGIGSIADATICSGAGDGDPTPLPPNPPPPPPPLESLFGVSLL